MLRHKRQMPRMRERFTGDSHVHPNFENAGTMTFTDGDRVFEMKTFLDKSIVESQYECVSTLGAGTFGECGHVRFAKGGDAALKTIRLIKADMVLFQASNKMSKTLAFALAEHITHRKAAEMVPNGVVKLYDAAVVQTLATGDWELLLLMELMPNGSWFSRHASSSKEQKLHWLKDLAMTLEKLHSIGFIHRDLHSKNVLFDKNDNARLADFGNACMKDYCGTRMANVTHPAEPLYDILSICIMGLLTEKWTFENLGSQAICQGDLLSSYFGQVWFQNNMKINCSDTHTQTLNASLVVEIINKMLHNMRDYDGADTHVLHPAAMASLGSLFRSSSSRK